MKHLALTLLCAAAVAAGCSAPSEPAPAATKAPTTAAPAAPAPESSAVPMRNFAPITIGAYQVQPMYEEEIEDGHLNIAITGGEVKAVRVWVGKEDASDAMVVKTEIEGDYHHGHVEVPSPIPADAQLWVEIEPLTGELLKGSTPLS